MGTHTLHRLARASGERGRRVRASSLQCRFAHGAARIDGCRLRGAEAYGKHLLLEFDDDTHLHVHLGLARAMFEVGAASGPSRGIGLRLEPEASPTVCISRPRSL